MKKVILKFNVDDLSGITKIDDFFTITGIAPYLKNKTITDVKQMEMNIEDGSDILRYWLKNWHKVKECRGLREKYAKSRISFTWMNYAPCYSKNCMRGVIILTPKEEK